MKIVPIKKTLWQRFLNFFKSERRLAEEYLKQTLDAIQKERENRER